MIAAAMVYALVVALLLGLAALAVDRLLALRRLPRRGVWAGVLVASFLVPAAMLASSSLRTHPAMVAGAEPAFRAIGTVEVSDARRVQGPLAYTALQWPVRPGLDPVLLALWALSTATVLLWLARAALQFRSSARTWRRRRLGNATVLITNDVGPAVLGVTKPRIVMPRWLLTAPVSMRSMVFRHEREHIAAGDLLVLRAGFFLLSLTPWNLALWWFLRRLRTALEMDCDARVLRGGADLRTYAESLLLVSEHRPRTPLAGTALTETVSQLERRIQFMISDIPRRSIALLGALAAIALFLCASAAALDPPSLSAAELEKSPPTSDRRLPSNLGALVKERYPDLLSRKTAGTPVVSVLFRGDGSIELTSYADFDGSPHDFKPTKDYYAHHLGIPSGEVSYIGLQGVLSPATGQTILVAFTERGTSGAPSPAVTGTPDTRAIDRSLTERYFPEALSGRVDSTVRLWILFDSEGRVLRNGQEPRDDEPIEHALKTRFPGIETEYVSDTVIYDRTARVIRDSAGEPLGLLCVWLKKGSPLPGGGSGSAAQPDRLLTAAGGTAVAIHMKWLINGVNVGTPGGAEAFEIKTATGQEFTRTVSLAPGELHETACRASVPTDSNLSATWDAVKASAKTSGKPVDNLILLECRLSSNGKVFSTPALAVGDGKTGIIETVDTANRARIRLELTASRSDKT